MHLTSGFDAGPSEWVVCEEPFIVRRCVKWGECDPAGVVYTVNFSEYVISLANRFYAYLLGAPLESAKDEHGFGTPVKALSFLFHKSLRPDERFDMKISVSCIRERSFDLKIEATDENGEGVFSATPSPICVARAERRSIPIPRVFRERLLACIAANVRTTSGSIK
ncbi:thioesterase (plasmid) [Burkholderia sp. JP2-270]|uniref:acyl-CoA thioesterase n=1 Tax=Burkholderia sp. JP2-270 TaxID=2217913 RepID=UPI000DA37455|nr:acyl-CoA thioesterase [Burkholderia sp. JP2-270]AWV05651.1 thioesterase [Burkholderia sp. JP2-270]